MVEKAPAVPTSAAVVGLELGNRLQVDMLIAAVNRIGGILENKNEATEDHLKEVMSRLPPDPRR